MFELVLLHCYRASCSIFINMVKRAAAAEKQTSFTKLSTRFEKVSPFQRQHDFIPPLSTICCEQKASQLQPGRSLGFALPNLDAQDGIKGYAKALFKHP